MTKKAWMLLLVFVAILGTYWVYRVYAPALLSGATERTVQIVAPVTRRNAANGRVPPWLQPAPPMSLSEALAKIPHPHLRPDQRFLEAAAFASSFPAVPTQPVAAAEFKDGMWTIRADNRMLGVLPPYPDFSDALTLLRSEAQPKAGTVHADCKLPDAVLASQVTVFDEKTLENALYRLNGEYRAATPEPANIYLAAQAMVRLAYLEDDKTGTADALYAKAMALVAMAEAACGKSMLEEESLLAASMGYSAAADTAVQKLPAQDAWKLYFVRDDDDLERMARLNSDSRTASYFWMRRLADLGRSQDWLAWLKQRYGGMTTPVYVMDTDLALPGRPPIELYAHSMPVLVLAALPGSENIKVAPVDPVADPAAAIHLFDAGVPYMGKVFTGPYLTAADITAYYRGFFYSGLYEEGYLLIDFLDSMDDAKQYDQLLSSAFGKVGHEFYHWYDAKVRSQQGTLSLPMLMQGMATTRIFSPGLYNEIWPTVTGQLGNLNNEVRSAVWQLASLYDTRANMRQDDAAQLNWVYDFTDSEDAFASLASQESPVSPSMRLRMNGYQGDIKHLLQAANDSTLPKDTRVAALTYVWDVRDAAPEIRAAYEGIIQAYPDYSFAYKTYIEFLYAMNDYVDIQRIARIWLASQNSDDTSFSYDNATVSLADAQAKQGQLDQAWATISRVTFSGGVTPAVGQTAYIVNFYARVLAEASYIARMRKNFTAAEFLSRTEAGRYPNDLADQMPLVKALWAEQRYADAAEYLAKWPYPIAAWQWDHVIGAEYGAFFKLDTDDAVIAFKSVLNTQPRRPDAFELHGIVLGAAFSYPAVGFALDQAMMAAPPQPADIQRLVEDYTYLKRVKGKAAAIVWLKSNLPAKITPEQQDRLAGVCYQNQAYRLLWDLFPDPNALVHPDTLWLLRAAAYVQQAHDNVDRQRQLRAHFIKAGNDWYALLGKYLLKQVGGNVLMDRPLDSHAMSEASYYAALRALSEKHYYEAQEWLEVDANAHRPDSAEFHWGQALQSYWYDANESLAVLDRKGELYARKYARVH